MITRQIIYSLLTDPDDPSAVALMNIVPVARINSSGSGTPTKPFITIRQMPDSRFTTDNTTRVGGVSIHIHDGPDSYVKIDQIQGLIIPIMDAAGAQWVRGVWVMNCRDLGWSEDLFDDHYGTATRYGEYEIVTAH